MSDLHEVYEEIQSEQAESCHRQDMAIYRANGVKLYDGIGCKSVSTQSGLMPRTTKQIGMLGAGEVLRTLEKAHD